MKLKLMCTFECTLNPPVRCYSSPPIVGDIRIQFCCHFFTLNFADIELTYPEVQQYQSMFNM